MRQFVGLDLEYTYSTATLGFKKPCTNPRALSPNYAELWSTNAPINVIFSGPGVRNIDPSKS
jgi:hypothetical protein